MAVAGVLTAVVGEMSWPNIPVSKSAPPFPPNAISWFYLMRVKRRACGISEARRVCQDESDTIISGALRRLTVRGSKPDKNALYRRIKCGRTISGSQR
jgi:hypothetical protein